MSALWITLFIVGYVLGVIATARFFGTLEVEDEPAAILGALFWPIGLTAAVAWWSYHAGRKAVDNDEA